LLLLLILLYNSKLTARNKRTQGSLLVTDEIPERKGEKIEILFVLSRRSIDYIVGLYVLCFNRENGIKISF